MPIRLSDDAPGRGGEITPALFEGFKGYLHTDGYTGYAPAHQQPCPTPVCWRAHARRFYVDALKAIRLIQKLYRIEKRVRKEEAVPILEAFLQWLQHPIPKVTPTSARSSWIAYYPTGRDSQK